jgi:hypothetical protein
MMAGVFSETLGDKVGDIVHETQNRPVIKNISVPAFFICCFLQEFSLPMD